MIEQQKLALDEYFKSTSAYHERIDAKHGRAYYSRYISLLEESIGDGPFLDIACGTGWVINNWAIQHGDNHIGIDISIPGMILAAKNSGQPYNTSFITGSGNRLPFVDNHFQTVGALTFLEHSSDPFTSLAEMVRVLKPGGRLILCHTNFMSPFAPHIKKNAGTLILSFLRNIFLWGGWKRFFTMGAKLLLPTSSPWFVEPILDAEQIGEVVFSPKAYFPTDPDAIYLVNPVDLTRKLTELGMIINICTTWGAYQGTKTIMNRIPYINVIGPGCTVVAQKTL